MAKYVDPTTRPNYTIAPVEGYTRVEMANALKYEIDQLAREQGVNFFEMLEYVIRRGIAVAK